MRPRCTRPPTSKQAATRLRLNLALMAPLQPHCPRIAVHLLLCLPVPSRHIAGGPSGGRRYPVLTTPVPACELLSPITTCHIHVNKVLSARRAAQVVCWPGARLAGIHGMAGFNRPPDARPATGYNWVAYRGAALRPRCTRPPTSKQAATRLRLNLALMAPLQPHCPRIAVHLLLCLPVPSRHIAGGPSGGRRYPVLTTPVPACELLSPITTCHIHVNKVLSARRAAQVVCWPGARLAGIHGMAGFNRPPDARPATGYNWVACRGAALRTSAPVPRLLDKHHGRFHVKLCLD